MVIFKSIFAVFCIALSVGYSNAQETPAVINRTKAHQEFVVRNFKFSDDIKKSLELKTAKQKALSAILEYTQETEIDYLRQMDMTIPFVDRRQIIELTQKEIDPIASIEILFSSQVEDKISQTTKKYFKDADSIVLAPAWIIMSDNKTKLEIVEKKLAQLEDKNDNQLDIFGKLSIASIALSLLSLFLFFTNKKQELPKTTKNKK